MRYWCTLRGVHPDTEQPFTLNRMASPRPRRTGLIVGIAAGAVVLVGATVAVTIAATRDTTTTTAPQQNQAAAAATTAAPPAAATTTAAAPQAPAVLKMGTKADGPKQTAIAYSYKQPVAANAPRPDQEGWEWGAADVEVCATKGSGYLNDLSWVLVYADHTRIEASGSIYQQFPQPEYPVGDTDIVAGQCIRGWITYPVPAGKRPATVHYQPQGFQADWQVS